MALTRLDFHIFRGQEASLVTSSFAALNPTQRAGSLVVAGSTAASTSIGSQVACRLSLEHFVDGVLSFFDKANSNGSPSSEISLAVLEAAFKNSNSSVYSFGHKLAAGGRMSASLVGLVVHDNVLAAGRVGSGGAYLVRRGQLFPFFEPGAQNQASPASMSYLGAQSLVSVELASIPAEESDYIFLTSESLSSESEGLLCKQLSTPEMQQSLNPCTKLCDQLFENPSKVPFAMLMKTGPNTIYLRPTESPRA